MGVDMTETYRLGIDIGSTTVKVAILDSENHLLFSDYRRHFANIQETLADLLEEAKEAHGDLSLRMVVTGSGGLTLAKHMGQPFCQEVVAVATALKENYPKTDVAIELGGEDAKIIYFKGGIDQRMNGICAGGTGSFIDQMASLLHTDATGLNELAKNYQMPHAAVFLPKRIFNRSSTKVLREKTSRLPFFRRFVTRPSPVLHRESRFADTSPSSAALFTLCRNSETVLSALCI